MRTVTLSGWGQPHDALKEAAEGATHLDTWSPDVPR